MRKLLLLALITSVAIPTSASAQRYYARAQLDVAANSADTPEDPADPTDPADPPETEEPEDSFHKIPTRASIPSTTVPLISGKVYVATHLGGVECWNTSKDTLASDPAACDTLPNPSNVGYIPVGGAASEDVKKVYFNSSELLSIAPTLTNVSALCNGTTDVFGETWGLTCNAADLIDEERYVVVARNIKAHVNNGNPVPERSAAGQLSVGNYEYKSCWDTQLGSASAQTNCPDYNEVRSDIVTSTMISATWNENLRTILVDAREVGALGHLAEFNPGAVAAFCSSSVQVARKSTYPQIIETWQIRCDPEEARDHWVKTAGSIAPAQATANNVGSQRTAQQLAVNLLSGLTCLDMDNMSPAAASHCAFHNPLQYGGQSATSATHQIPGAVWNVPARSITISRAYLEGIPHLLAINPSAVSNFCGSTIQAYNGSTVNYTVICA